MVLTFVKGEFNDFALLIKTFSASGNCGANIIGTFGFMIPAFSFAIALIVFPNVSVWSRLILVITDTMGLRTLVASSLPPIPTSIIWKSTSISLKCKNAIAVNISNVVMDPSEWFDSTDFSLGQILLTKSAFANLINNKSKKFGFFSNVDYI